LWGKKAEYFAGREGLLAKVAALAPLHSTATGLGGTPGVVVHGHLSVPEWHALLAESRFLLGLGACRGGGAGGAGCRAPASTRTPAPPRGSPRHHLTQLAPPACPPPCR